MNNKINIILQTAEQLTKEYPSGWIGDNCDLVAASGSVSQNLSTSDVRGIQEYYANSTLSIGDITFTFYRHGRDKMIKIEKVNKKT